MPNKPKKTKSGSEKNTESRRKQNHTTEIAIGEQRQERPMLRAIRVTPELLAAAKEYKKATGKSFYALGLEAIMERLEKEGFLKSESA